MTNYHWRSPFLSHNLTILSGFLAGQGGCQDDDDSVNMAGGPPTCAILAADRFHADGTNQCAKDHILGQHCKVSCGTCKG